MRNADCMLTHETVLSVERELAVSRVLSRAIIHLGGMSPCRSCDLPGDSADHACVPLFGLAPDGVYHAIECCHRCGALLPHPFTLTGSNRSLNRSPLRRSTLCCTFRRLTPPRYYLAPCPVEPGLSSPDKPHQNIDTDDSSDSLANSGTDGITSPG